MEENKNRDKWVNEILTSADNIKRADASPYIYPKILHRLKKSGEDYSMISIKKAAYGVITVFVLFMLNMFVIFTPFKDKGNTDFESKEGSINSTEEQMIPSQINPYLEILNN